MIYRPAHDRELLKEYLPKVPIFQNVSGKYLQKVIDDFGLLHAKRHEVIVFQMDTTTELFIILRGRVKVTLLSEDGEEFILTDVREGDFFGEISLIDGDPRSATVVAEEDCSFAVLDREVLLGLIKEEPMIALAMLTSIGRRLRESTEREHRLAFLDVRERLLNLLERLARQEGTPGKDGFYRISKRTHKELGARIGASREAISKVLKGLASTNTIFEQNDSILIAPEIMED